MTDVAIDSQESWRRREFRRFLVGSLLFHGALFLTMIVSTNGELSVPRGIVSVELVSLPAPKAPRASAPPAPPKPAPPPAPVQEKIVLPKESRLPPPKPEQVKPKPAPAPVRKELTPEDLAQPQEQDYEDVMAQLRAESDDVFPPAEAPEEVAKAPAPAGAPTGTGRPISPEEAVWMRKAKIHVRQAWTLTPGFRTQVLEAHVVVELDASGTVIGEPKILRRSGNPWYDDSVVRALEKASPLPAPPAPGDWSFVFVPDDYLR